MVNNKYSSPEIELIYVTTERGFAGSGFGEFNFPGQAPDEVDYGEFSF